MRSGRTGGGVVRNAMVGEGEGSEMCTDISPSAGVEAEGVQGFCGEPHKPGKDVVVTHCVYREEGMVYTSVP